MRLRRPHGFAAWMRIVVGVAVTAFLVYYVGPRTVGATVLKVVAAVGISAAFFIGANKLFDLAYGAWTWFCTIAGFVVGAVAFGVLDGDHVLRELPGRPWLWALIGGAVTGAAMFAVAAVSHDRTDSAPSPLRLPVAVASFVAIGVLLAVAGNEDHQPALAWGTLLLCAAIGGVLFGGIRAVSGGTTREIALSASTGAGVGWLIGAWGGAEYATSTTSGGNVGEALVASVIPPALIGVAMGLRRRRGAGGRR